VAEQVAAPLRLDRLAIELQVLIPAFPIIEEFASAAAKSNTIGIMSKSDRHGFGQVGFHRATSR
jgi:hypothetical protein